VVDTEINSPLVGAVWFALAVTFTWWYNGRLRHYKEARADSDGSSEAHARLRQLSWRVTVEGFAGMICLIAGLYLLAWLV